MTDTGQPPKTVSVHTELFENGLLLITLSRPESGNSLHPTLVAELLKIVQWANASPVVGVIVITGRGRFFCTGLNLDDSGPALSFAPGDDFHRLNQALIESEKILIAAVNGPGIGYGLTVLALFDLVYSVPEAYFFTPFVKWGMAAEGSSSYTLPHIMGYHSFARLWLAEERIDASEAQRLGLVSKIFPKDELLREVLEVGQRIAKQPRSALRATKRLVKAPIKAQMLAANDAECTAIHTERLPSGEPQKLQEQFKASQRQRVVRPGKKMSSL